MRLGIDLTGEVVGWRATSPLAFGRAGDIISLVADGSTGMLDAGCGDRKLSISIERARV
jgi:hypothetical protein